MERLHTARRREAIQKSKSAVVYVFPPPQAEENGKTRVNRAVYLSESTVDLYTFDAAYLARLRARHPETLAHFGAYFTRLLTIKLRSSGLPKSSGDDIRQETLLRVLKAVQADKVEEPEKLGPYVFSVCKNVTQEWWRDERTNRDGDGEETFDFPDPAIGPEEAVRTEEMRKTVAWILEQVSKKDRKILIAVFIDEQEKDDICREFSVSREYLRVLVHRALRSAREKLGESPES